MRFPQFQYVLLAQSQGYVYALAAPGERASVATSEQHASETEAFAEYLRQLTAGSDYVVVNKGSTKVYTAGITPPPGSTPSATASP